MVHHRSKISRLPETAITQINEFLDANVEYARIIDWLNQQGHSGIEHYHISRWRDSGYLDWLQAQEHQADLDRKLQWAEKHASSESHSQLHKAAMGLIALKLFDAINRLDSTDLSDLLQCKPEKIFTLINSYARYAHEFIHDQRFTQQQQVRLASAKKPASERLSDEARAQMLEELRLALTVPAGLIPAPASAPHATAQDTSPCAPVCT